jgi:hypothetical protein
LGSTSATFDLGSKLFDVLLEAHNLAVRVVVAFVGMQSSILLKDHCTPGYVTRAGTLPAMRAAVETGEGAREEWAINVVKCGFYALGGHELILLRTHF